MPRLHDIKIHEEFFAPVFDGQKTFEVRRNDKNYMPGDIVIMREWSLEHGFTGRAVCKEIGYVTAFNQRPGWCVFSLL